MATVDEAIKEVALRHGVSLGRNDPVLVVLTINEMMLKDAKEQQERLLAGFQSDLEGAMTRLGVEMTDKAERTVAAAVRAARDTLSTQAEEHARRSAALFDAAATKAADAVIQASNGVKPIAVLSFGSALVAVAAAVIAVLFAR
ncbi:transcriptional activator TraM [Azospirillum brasilense]|nr:transcriptional activator TraM [Azospirillum brasilense]